MSSPHSSPHASSCSRLSKLRAHDARHDDVGDPPAFAPWVNDDEDAVRYDFIETGPVSLIDGDLEAYRQREAED